MPHADNIEKKIEQMNFKSTAALRDRILSAASPAMEKTINAAANRPSVGRIFMKSKITKFATAAVVIMIVVLSVIVLDQSMPSAYALEQTIEAYAGLRYVHITDFIEGESEPREFWMELNDQEQVKRVRLSLPAWAERNGPMVGVWKEGKLQLWGKKDNVLGTKHVNSLDLEILTLVKKFDPRSLVRELHQLETTGKVEIKTDEPKLKSEPITITVNNLTLSNDTGTLLVLSVDQHTKLVTRIVFNKPDDFDGHRHSWEFSDYNIAVDERLFMLSEVPENVKRLEVTKYDREARYNPAEIGLTQDELEDNEIATTLARQFVQALIDKDYEKAGKLCRGIPADTADKLAGLVANRTYNKILCIEPPVLSAHASTKTMNVPCVVGGRWGGVTLVMRMNIGVEPYMADSNRWVVDCNDLYKRLETIVDPTDTTTTFMKNINAKLATLDINKSAAEEVVAALGKPWAYGYRGKDLEEDNLPEVYTMDYPGGFLVSIYKNQVLQWGCQQITEDECAGYILHDSIQIGTTLDDVFGRLGSPTKVVEGFGTEDNRIMYEDTISYANMNIKDRRGFYFFQYGNNGEKIKLHLDDNVLYKHTGKAKGLCFYGTVSNGRRVRFVFRDNKVVSLIEYRTEPLGIIDIGGY
ncbi:hypothetical protein ACFL6U_18155 [Planctomycetota bacterium]